MSNLPALGRFRVTDVGSYTDAETNVALATNLSGEPIRFTLNESMSSIVSSASLVILNAEIDELGEMSMGVLGEWAPTEEDQALWGTIVEGASVEPNQMVWVTETFGAETCTTYWRVVDFQTYVDENSIPYCEVNLESLPMIALNAKIDPSKLGSSDKSFILILLKEYWESLLYWKDVYTVYVDGYNGEDTDVTSESLASCRKIVTGSEEYINPIIDLLKGDEATAVNYWSFAVEGLPTLENLPLEKMLFESDKAWDVFIELLGMNGYTARFTRDKRLIFWSLDSSEPPLGDTSVGTLGTGLTLSYSKEGVVTHGTVKGYVGVKKDGYWIPNGSEEKSTEVVSTSALNITNGEKVKETYEIPVDTLLVDETYRAVMRNWGMREIYKTVLAARGASVNSEGLPLAVEVGMTVTGTSSLIGQVSFFVSSLNRQTDVQQKKVNTSISGSVNMIGSSSEIGWE